MSMLSSYPYTTDMISQDTKENLSENCSRRGSNFDSSIIRRSQSTRCGIDVADHEISEVDSEEIVGVSVTKMRSGSSHTSRHTIRHQQLRLLCPHQFYQRIEVITEHDTKKTLHCPFWTAQDACAPWHLNPFL